MIRVENLNYRYPGKSDPVLKHLRFHVNEGEIFALLGPSGAGKSTTLLLLTGVLKSYDGSIRVFGKELKTTGNDYYERIGVAFETPNFYHKFTALENLRFFRSLYAGPTEEPESLLKRLNLGEYADLKVGRFSKGMKMRLNLCRAIMHRPELLFLDEPTAGLDPVNTQLVRNLLMELKRQGTTVFLNTHNMHAAEQWCDRVAFMADGELKLIAPPRKIKTQYGRKQVDVEYRSSGKRMKKTFPLEGLGDNPEFLHLLRHAEVETLHSQEATLEHIFIRVTGRSLS